MAQYVWDNKKKKPILKSEIEAVRECPSAFCPLPEPEKDKKPVGRPHKEKEE